VTTHKERKGKGRATNKVSHWHRRPCPTCHEARNGGNRPASYRMNRLKLKTPGILPIVLKASMEHASNLWNMPRICAERT
jgi:hypothetical protein